MPNSSKINRAQRAGLWYNGGRGIGWPLTLRPRVAGDEHGLLLQSPRSDTCVPRHRPELVEGCERLTGVSYRIHRAQRARLWYNGGRGTGWPLTPRPRAGVDEYGLLHQGSEEGE
jgi:hypothetical protein